MRDVFEYFVQEADEARVRNYAKQSTACNSLFLEYRKGTTQDEKNSAVAYGALMNEYKLLSIYYTKVPLNNFDLKECFNKIMLHHFNLKAYHASMFNHTNLPIEKVRKEINEGLCAGATAIIKIIP